MSVRSALELPPLNFRQSQASQVDSTTGGQEAGKVARVGLKSAAHAEGLRHLGVGNYLGRTRAAAQPHRVQLVTRTGFELLRPSG